MKIIAQPGSYVPLSPSEFIGSAAAVGRTLSAKAIALLKTGDPARLILHGVPGTGKSRLAEMFARHVSSHAIYLEKVIALNAVLEYMQHEEADYESAGQPENHIWRDLDTLKMAVVRNKSTHCRKRISHEH